MVRLVDIRMTFMAKCFTTHHCSIKNFGLAVGAEAGDVRIFRINSFACLVFIELRNSFVIAIIRFLSRKDNWNGLTPVGQFDIKFVGDKMIRNTFSPFSPLKSPAFNQLNDPQ